MKENASHGLAEVIKLTSPEALKPSVVHITGPLIRILGDRFGANVKTGTSYFRPGSFLTRLRPCNLITISCSILESLKGYLVNIECKIEEI